MGHGAIAACTAALLLACGGGEYDAYRASHPDWDGAFPREGASLAEVLAGLHKPPTVEGVRIELKKVEVWRQDGDVSKHLDLEALKRGDAEVPADADLFVLAQRGCRAERGLEELEIERLGTYLLPGGRVEAFDHPEFGKLCAVTSQFRAARGDAIPLERAAATRVSVAFGRVPVDLAQLYQRGLAYLEAGRVDEAEAALTRGEIGFRGMEQRVADGAIPRSALDEAARLRARLMRALGVEAREIPLLEP